MKAGSSTARSSSSGACSALPGRGPVEYEDFDDDEAVGGRLDLETDAVCSLTVGASAYRGGYYDRSAKYLVTGSGGLDQEYTTNSKYQEFSLGTDLKGQWKRGRMQGEFIMNSPASSKAVGRACSAGN